MHEGASRREREKGGVGWGGARRGSIQHSRSTKVIIDSVND